MLVIAVATLFALAAVTPVLVRLLGRNTGYLGAVVLAGWTVALGLRAPEVLAGTAVTSEVAWLPAAGLSLSLRMDAIGLLFALIVLGIGALVLAYAARYFPAGSDKAARYLALLTTFAGAMLGLVLADDIVLLFVFWELTSISSFFLIGGLGEGKQGATRAFLVTALGGLSLLAGVLLLQVAAGTASIAAMVADPSAILASPVLPGAIVLLLVAAFTKSAQFPFHFWLPGAMVAPTPVSTYLHAATMVKAGIYLLFRFTGVFAGVALWQVSLVLVGFGTAVFAAVVAMKATDLKRLLAYSTVSQLGFLTGLIGIGTPLALAAAGLHVLAHALYKAALFMTVGVVDHETGTRDIRELGGLRRTLPLTATAGGLAAISMAGLPPLVGFVSKEEAFAGVVEGTTTVAWLGPVGAVLAVVASIGTFAYSTRYYLRTFEGPERTPAHHAPALFELPALLLALAGVALGVVVPLLDPLVNGVAVAATGAGPDLHLALWHGLTVPLAMSAVVVGVGVLLVVARNRVEVAQDRVTTPTGASAFDRTYDAILSFGGLVGRLATSNRPAAYLLPVLAVVLSVGAAAVWTVDIVGPPAPSLRADWAIVILLGLSILGVAQARSRLGAVANLGLAGFLVAGWFVLIGAPDLALTQLLVETLTVALVVVVFRRLPEVFIRGEARRKVGAGAIAVIVGVLAGAATYALTGRRDISAVGQRYLDEGASLTGGDNVVNTILVDFRALDTLGEITVLGVAGLGIYAIVRLVQRGAIARPPDRPIGADDPPASRGALGGVVLRTANTVLAPIMVIASLWLLVRGHDAVGGGFIGGLTAGSAVVLLYLSQGHERVWRSRFLRIVPLIGSGLAIGVGYGLAGLGLTGALLAGGKVTLPGGLQIAPSLVFDVGVYLVVIGMVVAIVRHLGQGLAEDTPAVGRGGTEPPSRAATGTDRPEAAP